MKPSEKKTLGSEEVEGKKTFHGWKNTSDGDDLRLLLTGNTGKTSLWPLISPSVHLSSLSFSIYPFLSLSLLSSSNPAMDTGLLGRGLYVSTSLTSQLTPPPRSHGHRTGCHGKKSARKMFLCDAAAGHQRLLTEETRPQLSSAQASYRQQSRTAAHQSGDSTVNLSQFWVTDPFKILKAQWTDDWTDIWNKKWANRIPAV